MDSFFGDVFFLVASKRKDLVAARIGQNWSMPIHKLMKTASFCYYLGGWSLPEMVSVSENNARFRGFDLFWTQSFDGGLRANGHKHGGFVCLNVAIFVSENSFAVSCAGGFVLMDKFVCYFHENLLFDEHRVAKREKAIFLGDSVLVGFKDKFFIGEGRN